MVGIMGFYPEKDKDLDKLLEEYSKEDVYKYFWKVIVDNCFQGLENYRLWQNYDDITFKGRLIEELDTIKKMFQRLEKLNDKNLEKLKSILQDAYDAVEVSEKPRELSIIIDEWTPKDVKEKIYSEK
ncbi:MAG: hypothetical protein ACOCP8_07355 [archaeon]